MAEARRQRARAITKLPRSVERASAVIVFGGSFDPPHRWHAAVAKAARVRVERELKRERDGAEAWVLFVPAARSPHKADGPRAGDADRVEMLRRATARMTRAAVWTDEMDRAVEGAPSYTVETLRRLRKKLPRDARVWLLMGADQAEKFHVWRERREVLRLAEPLVVLRPPMRSAGALVRRMRAAGAWTEDDLTAWGARVVKCDVRAVSSTAVRAAARRGNPAALRRLVAPAVASWIESGGLYGAKRAVRGIV